jgi:hypothetical protein
MKKSTYVYKYKPEKKWFKGYKTRIPIEPALLHEYHTFNQPRERFTIESSDGDFV